MCEPIGYCSFPDDDCPSGRRFASHAGGGLASLCVPPDDVADASTTTGTSTPTSGPLTTSTTTPATSTTGLGDESSTSSPAQGTDGSTTTGPTAESSSSTGGDLPSQGLVAWYSFENDPVRDNGVPDETSNNHDSTCTLGLCPASTPGRVGNGVRFDGVDDYLVIPDQEDFVFTQGMSVSLWVRYRGSAPDGSPLARPFGASSSNSYELFETTKGTQIAWNTDSDAAARATVPVSFGKGVWAHIVGTWDGEAMRVYLNGQLEDTDRNATSIAYDDHSVLIGADENSGAITNTWRGSIDELRIYNRPLTFEEIAALAAQ